MTQERRNFWRVAFISPAQLQDESGRIYRGQLHDLSLKGALLAVAADDDGAERLGQSGTRLQLQLALSDEVTIRMQTTLMHRHERLLGLRCDAIDLDSVTALRRLVELNADDPALLDRELNALLHST